MELKQAGGAEMSDLGYPIVLDRAAIESLLPHRAPALFIEQVTAPAHDHFLGKARWEPGHPLLRGHFPGCAVVPGVLLIEAAAQVTGAGLLAADPVARAIGPGHLGMLTAVRKCFFRRPVRPDDVVSFELRCRRMGEKAVVAAGAARLGDEDAAQIEILVTHVPVGQLEAVLPRDFLDALARGSGSLPAC